VEQRTGIENEGDAAVIAHFAEATKPQLRQLPDATTRLLADLALRNRLPAINTFPDFAQNGGLIGYGPDLQSLLKQTGLLTRKVLQGASVGDLPIERPTRFKLVANLKTASALGLTLPTSILLSADEVIE